MGTNIAIVSGNLTRDPDLKVTPNGNSICSFTVAYNNSYKDGNGNTREEVAFIDCQAWGKTGETIAHWFRKGGMITVKGRIKMDEWDDKQSGQKRTKLKIDCTFTPGFGGFDFMGFNGKGAPERGQQGGDSQGQQHSYDQGGGDAYEQAPPNSLVPPKGRQQQRPPQQQEHVDDDVPF